MNGADAIVRCLTWPSRQAASERVEQQPPRCARLTAHSTAAVRAVTPAP